MAHLLGAAAGMFVGSWLSGAAVEHDSQSASVTAGVYDWRSMWLVPVAASVLILLVFLVMFRDRVGVGVAKVAEPIPEPVA